MAKKSLLLGCNGKTRNYWQNKELMAKEGNVLLSYWQNKELMAKEGNVLLSYWQNKELILTVLVFNLGHKT